MSLVVIDRRQFTENSVVSWVGVPPRAMPKWLVFDQVASGAAGG